MTALWVVLGAAIGAPVRYLTDRAVQARHGSRFPWGTFTVNAVGSLLMGALAGPMLAHELPDTAMALFGVGLCGTLTTYSTFGYETVRLLEDGAVLHALVNVTASIGAGLGAAFTGATVALALWP